MKRIVTSAFSLAAVLLASLPASAQYGAVWGDTQVEVEMIDPSSAAPPDSFSPTSERGEDSPTTDFTTNPRTFDPSDLPSIPDYDDVLVLNQRARSATVPVRATFRRDPLITPNIVEVEGVATWVQPAEGEQPILVTASILVNGAETVVIESPDGPITVNVQPDSRYGLAVVQSNAAPPAPGVALSLTAAESETVSRVFGPLDGSIGSTVGNRQDETAYYQMNDLGVTLGHPIIDDDGRIIGIGSHFHPAIPGRALSVPAESVQRFLASSQEESVEE